MPYVTKAAAKGVVYFDDGISYEKRIKKTEIFYTYSGYNVTTGANATVV